MSNDDFTTSEFAENPDFAATQPSDDAVEAEFAEFVQEHPADFTEAPVDDAAQAAHAVGDDLDKPLDDKAAHDRITPDQLGEGIVKFATETAYAAVGFAGLVGDKAKAFYEDQKRQYAETHPEAEREAGAKDFLNQLKDQLDKFFADFTKGYRDLADRGRETSAKAEASFARRNATTAPGPVDGTAADVAEDVADEVAEDFGRPAADFVEPDPLPEGVSPEDYAADVDEEEGRRVIDDVLEGDVLPPMHPSDPRL